MNDWYVEVYDHHSGRWRDSGEGPWETRTDALHFATNEVGGSQTGDWRIRRGPAGGGDVSWEDVSWLHNMIWVNAYRMADVACPVRGRLRRDCVLYQLPDRRREADYMVWATSVDEAHQILLDDPDGYFDPHLEPATATVGYSLGAPGGDARVLRHAALESVTELELTLDPYAEGESVTREDTGVYRLAETINPAMCVMWMYFIAELVDRYGAPVTVEDQDSAFVAADWLFENMPAGESEAPEYGRVAPVGVTGWPVANLLSDAVVDLVGGSDELEFVIETTQDDGEIWHQLAGGFPHRRAAVDWAGVARYKALTSTPPTTRIVPASMSEAEDPGKYDPR